MSCYFVHRRDILSSGIKEKTDTSILKLNNIYIYYNSNS